MKLVLKSILLGLAYIFCSAAVVHMAIFAWDLATMISSLSGFLACLALFGVLFFAAVSVLIVFLMGAIPLCTILDAKKEGEKDESKGV